MNDIEITNKMSNNKEEIKLNEILDDKQKPNRNKGFSLKSKNESIKQIPPNSTWCYCPQLVDN